MSGRCPSCSGVKIKTYEAASGKIYCQCLECHHMFLQKQVCIHCGKVAGYWLVEPMPLCPGVHTITCPLCKIKKIDTTAFNTKGGS